MSVFSKDKTQSENLEANARTQKAIDSGKSAAEIRAAEKIHLLVAQTAFYRGVDLTEAKKILSQILKGGPT